jgi:hypothetical protein
MVVAALAAGAAVAFAGSAAAEPAWTPPTELAPGETTGYALYPSLAMNGAGDVVAGWMWSAGRAR